jgi:hypothetical protein
MARRKVAYVKYHEDSCYKGIAIFLNNEMNSFECLFPEYSKINGEWVEVKQRFHASGLVERLVHLQDLGYRIEYR